MNNIKKVEIDWLLCVFFLFALALPLYSWATSKSMYPSKQIIYENIVESCPVQKAQCMETADVISSIASFYEVVIIVLIMLLTLISALVYMTIKAKSVRQIKDQIDEQFEKDFDSEWFRQRMQDKFEASTSTKLDEILQRIDNLESTLQRNSERDNSEDNVVEKTIIVDGGSDGSR